MSISSSSPPSTSSKSPTMSSPLLGILQALSPPQPVAPSRDFDGLEWRWKALVFRPSVFKFEGIMLAFLGAYLLVYFIGRTINLSRSKKTITAFNGVLSSQFAATKPLVSSGPAQHLSYSTGRRNVLALHGTLTLLPFHDLAGLAFHFGSAIVDPTYDGSEGLVWGLTLGRGENGLQGEGLGVWAVVEKGQLKQVRDKRWDLTFAKLQDNASLPFTHSLFTEHSDINDVLLKTPNVGITELLANKTAASVLKYLLVTDQPSRRPARGALPAKFRTREVVLALRKPSSQQEFEAAKAWLQVILNIADVEAKPNVIRQEVVRKLASTRKTVDADLNSAYAKEQAEDNPPEETAEEKRLAKKKAERANLSEKELKRLEDLDKKREIRKLQKKGQFKQ